MNYLYSSRQKRIRKKRINPTHSFRRLKFVVIFWLALQVVVGWAVIYLGAGRSVASAFRLLLLLLLRLMLMIVLLLIDTMNGVTFLFVTVSFLCHSAQFQTHSLDFGLNGSNAQHGYPMKKKRQSDKNNKSEYRRRRLIN